MLRYETRKYKKKSDKSHIIQCTNNVGFGIDAESDAVCRHSIRNSFKIRRKVGDGKILTLGSNVPPCLTRFENI